MTSFDKYFYRLFGSEDVDLRALNEKPNESQPDKKKTVNSYILFHYLKIY